MWLRGSPELRLASRGRLSWHPLHKNETSFRKPTIGRNRCFLNHKKQSQAPCVLRSVLTTFVLTSKSSQNPPKTPRYCRLALLRKCILPSKKPSQSDLNWAYLKMGRPTGLEPTLAAEAKSRINADLVDCYSFRTSKERHRNLRK